MQERRTLKAIDDDVKAGCDFKNMTDESLTDHLVLRSKLLTTYTTVRGEVMDVVSALAASAFASDL